MKYFTLIMLLFSIFIIEQEDVKLKGKFAMQFEEKFISQNCSIIFDDSIYERTLSNGKVIKGHIVNKKLMVSLKDDEGGLQMNFLKREILKDTIFFRTILNDEKSNNNNVLLINSGRLIKIKK